MEVLCICETEWNMNHLALVTSLKVSGSFPKIAGNFPEFDSDGVVDRVYNVTQLTGYLCFGFVYSNVSGDPLSSAHSMQCNSECCGHRLAAVSRQRKSHRRPVFDTQMNRLIYI
jgi:hypothetical protein